jgi:hypothetical protein
MGTQSIKTDDSITTLECRNRKNKLTKGQAYLAIERVSYHLGPDRHALRARLAESGSRPGQRLVDELPQRWPLRRRLS